MQFNTFFLAATIFISTICSNSVFAKDINVNELNARERVFVAQILLNRGGFNAGSADGKMGAKTRNALDDFRTSIEAYNYILKPLSNKDIRALVRKYGSVDTIKLNASATGKRARCSQFKRGSRVKFTAWYGRRVKTELIAYGTVLAVKGPETMLVLTDGHRNQASTVIKTGRKRKETVKCNKLTATRY